MDIVELTSLNQCDRSVRFFVVRPDQIVGVEAQPEDYPYQSVLFLACGTQVRVMETADKVLEILHELE